MEQWKKNLYTLWVTQVFSLMGFGLGIPFIPYYLQEMGITVSAQLNYYTGISAALPAAAMAISAPIWGIVADKYGRKLMIMRAMVAAVIILALMGFTSNVWQFMFLRILQGVFTGTVTASMAFVSADTPEVKLSSALGLMTSSNFIGYSIGPLVGGLLAENFGYSMCFYIGSFIMFIGLIMVFFIVKENKSIAESHIKDNSSGVIYNKKLFSALIISIIVSLFFARISRSIFMPFVPLYVQEMLGGLKGAPTLTGIISGVTGFATAFAALTIARLGDAKSKLKVVFILTLISLPIAIIAAANLSLVLFIVLFTLFFFVSGAIEPILTSAASENTNPQMRGTLFGIITSVGSAALMVSPMMGSIISVKYGVAAILIFVPLLVLLQLAILIINRKVFIKSKIIKDEELELNVIHTEFDQDTL